MVRMGPVVLNLSDLGTFKDDELRGAVVVFQRVTPKPSRIFRLFKIEFLFLKKKSSSLLLFFKNQLR